MGYGLNQRYIGYYHASTGLCHSGNTFYKLVRLYIQGLDMFLYDILYDKQVYMFHVLLPVHYHYQSSKREYHNGQEPNMRPDVS